MDIFDSSCPWQKGNLHTHTTLSDGRKTVEEAIALYRGQGYDFLAITDHRKYFPHAEKNGLRIIPGTEFDRNYMSPNIAYHILGIGLEREVVQDPAATPQQILDAIHDAGGLSIVAHPGWSLMTHESLQELSGYDGMEIYNGVSEYYSGRGYYSDYADVLAANGIVKRLFATDDTHWYERDAFRGYIMVQAPDNTWTSIRKGIRENRYYSTQGPEFYQISLDETNFTLHVNSSPLCSVIFYSDTFFVGNRVQLGDHITHSQYKINSTDHYVRVEGIDANGKHVWSNFIQIPQ